MFVRGEQPPLKNRPSPTVLHNIPGVLGEYCKYGQSGKKKTLQCSLFKTNRETSGLFPQTVKMSVSRTSREIY